MANAICYDGVKIKKVFEKCKDSEGNYSCALSDYKSRNKLAFQIDHIKPLSIGGLTTLDNLQLLTRKENALKGSTFKQN